MLLLFQEGIPGIFFAELERRGFAIRRIPTDSAAALSACREHPDASAIFFRANFLLNRAVLDQLPKLQLAALVSTGADNVDVSLLQERGIRFVSGEGANAGAVFDYVIQALLLGGFDFASDSLGIVGAGRIGGRLLQFLRAHRVRTAFYDPLLENNGSLDAVLECDAVTFHTSLTRTGDYATAEMLNAAYFAKVKKKLRIIQASRGGIWQPDFYRSLTNHPYLSILAQDVYPLEPPASADLALAPYSTPHIAGYSTRGRLGGITKGIRALIPDFDDRPFLPESRAWFLEEDALHFEQNPQKFMYLRDNYSWRKEFHDYSAEERAAFLARFPAASGLQLFVPGVAP